METPSKQGCRIGKTYPKSMACVKGEEVYDTIEDRVVVFDPTTHNQGDCIPMRCVQLAPKVHVLPNSRQT